MMEFLLLFKEWQWMGSTGHLFIIVLNSSNDHIHPGGLCIWNHHVNEGMAMVNLTSLTGATVLLNYSTAICTASAVKNIVVGKKFSQREGLGTILGGKCSLFFPADSWNSLEFEQLAQKNMWMENDLAQLDGTTGDWLACLKTTWTQVSVIQQRGYNLKMATPSSHLTADAGGLEKVLPTKVIMTIMTPGWWEKVCFWSFPHATHSISTSISSLWG